MGIFVYLKSSIWNKRQKAKLIQLASNKKKKTCPLKQMDELYKHSWNLHKTTVILSQICTYLEFF